MNQKDRKHQLQGKQAKAEGKKFEQRLDAAFAYYREKGFALIEKTPEPMRVIKRLDNGKFCWPKSPNEVISISEQQLRWLMEGLEICQPKSIKMSQPKSII